MKNEKVSMRWTMAVALCSTFLGCGTPIEHSGADNGGSSSNSNGDQTEAQEVMEELEGLFRGGGSNSDNSGSELPQSVPMDDGNEEAGDERDDIEAPAETAVPDAEDSQTWSDSSSGLTWQNPPAPEGMHWYDALNYCADLTLHGGGWRLPDISELRSLIRGCSTTEIEGECNILAGGCESQSCLLNTARFMGEMGECQGCPDASGPGDGGCFWPQDMLGSCELVGGGTYYWSSTLVGDKQGKAWYVYFYEGSVEFGYNIEAGFSNSAKLSVRCVR